MLVLISHIFPYNENPLSISTPAVSGAVESAVIGAVLCMVRNIFQGTVAGAGAVENCLEGAGKMAIWDHHVKVSTARVIKFFSSESS